MRRRTAATLAIPVILAASPWVGCEWTGGDDIPPPDRDLSSDPDVALDTTVITDGPADVVEEEVVKECDRVVEEFEPLDQRAGYDDMYGDTWKVQGTFTPGFYSTPLDIVDVESWRSDGGPWTEGTYIIDHWVHRSYCGLCVWYFEGCTDPEDSNSCERSYNATEATLNLVSIDVGGGGLLVGTLTGVYMEEMDWSDGSRIPDGTSFCLDYWQFIENYEPISMW